jgi:predicted membrane-bound spermidine synthase
MSPRRTLIVGILVLVLGLGAGAVLGRSAIITPVTAPLLLLLVGGAIGAVAYLVFRREGDPTE